MALADVRTLTYGSRNKILHRKHSTPIIEMAGTSQMLPGPAAGEVAAGLSSPRGSAASEQTAAEGHAHICAWAATLAAERMDRLRLSHRDARLPFNWSLYAHRLAECDEATAVPVDYESVPLHVECKDMMTALVERQAVPQRVPQSDVSLRSPANRGLAGLSDAGLTFLGRNARGLLGALRSSINRLSAAVRSQRRPAVQLERPTHGAIVVALRQNRPLGKRECKDRGGRDCYCK